jgi:hypothetical protein
VRQMCQIKHRGVGPSLLKKDLCGFYATKEKIATRFSVVLPKKLTICFCKEFSLLRKY